MLTSRNTSSESGQGIVAFVLGLAVVAALVVLFTSWAFGWPWWDWRSNTPSQAQQLACISNPSQTTATAWFHKPLACAEYRASIGLGNGTTPSYPEKVVEACNLGLETVNFEGKEYTCADVNSTTPDPASTPEPGSDDDLATPNSGTSSDETCYLLGGRMFENDKGYETISVVLESWLQEGAPMQMFTSQVVNKSMALPDGLNLRDEFEIVNDSAQALVCGNDAFVFARDPWPQAGGDGNVLFLEISYIQKNASSVMVCEDDLGGSGSWSGLCAGSSVEVTHSTTVEKLLSLPDFQHYAAPLRAAMDATYTLTAEVPLQVVEVFTK